MKRILSLTALFVVSFFLVSCNSITSEFTTEVNTGIVTTTSVESTNAIVSTTQGFLLNDQLHDIYKLALDAGAFSGTYEEWI